jgi:hypothetical protein
MTFTTEKIKFCVLFLLRLNSLDGAIRPQLTLSHLLHSECGIILISLAEPFLLTGALTTILSVSQYYFASFIVLRDL